MRLPISILALALCCIANSASAAIVDRINTGGNWSAGNWSTGVLPTLDDTIRFGVDSLTVSNFSVHLGDSNRAVGGIIFGSSGTTLLRSNGSGTTNRNLNLGADGITMNAGSGHVTIGSADQKSQPNLNATQTWTNNSATSNLFVLGGGANNLINLNGNNLTLAGPGDFVLATLRGGALGGNAKIVGDLNFSNLDPFGLIFDPFKTLTVTGTTTFGVGTGTHNTFGIANLVGLDSSVGLGSYTLINGIVDFTNVSNVGFANAFDLGSGKQAYFSQGSLVLNVTAVPQPSSLALIGLFGTLIARRTYRRHKAVAVS